MCFPFRYALTDNEFRVEFLGLPVRKIAYSDIAEARTGYSWWNEHWTNFWPWRFVTIRRATGFFRNFVINPPDPEAFVAELKRRAGIG